LTPAPALLSCMSIRAESGKCDNQRVGAKWERSAYKGMPQMAFHHLIGFETLRDTWNKLLTILDAASPELRAEAFEAKLFEKYKKKGDPDAARLRARTEAAIQAPKLKEFLAATQDEESVYAAGLTLVTYMGLLGISKVEAFKILHEILLVRSREKARIDGFDRDELASRITWTGWNLIEGPEGSLRSDDDQNGYVFDNFEQSLEVCRLTRELAIAKQAELLNTKMQNFIKTRKVLKDLYLATNKKKQDEGRQRVFEQYGTIRAIRDQLAVMTAAGTFNPGELLCRFRPDMWVKLDKPPKPGRPWIKITREIFVAQALQRALGKIRAISAVTGVS
jgi:hypothetical protein